jgi:uroporphyrinogen-III synthase
MEIETASFIETAVVKDLAVIKQIKSYATQPITAIFTSMNAVEAVTQSLANKPNWQIYCMGGYTKELIYRFFGEEMVKGTGKNATALCEKIIANEEHQQNRPVVFFCGDHRLDELPETLKQHNIDIEELVVYNTTQTPQVIEKNYHAIVFFSPSAVHSFFSENTVSINTVLFSIGKTTTATIQTYCTNKIVTSEWPGKEQMIELVMQYFN